MMKNNNRLMVYLVINIIVSALTTLAVLFVWDWMHSGTTLNLNLPDLLPSPTETSFIESTLPPEGENLVQIENVFGAGHLQDEVVVIKRSGQGELWLTGWKLVDQHKHEYIFPRLSINKGEVNLYTRAGIDSVKDLHWGQPRAVWISGEKVRIYDPMGNLRSEYLIP